MQSHSSRLLGLLRRHPRRTLTTAALLLSSSLLIPGQAYLLTQVVSRAFLGQPSPENITGYLLGLLGLVTLRAGLTWGGEASAGALAIQIKTGLRRQVFERLLQSGPAFLKGEQTGEINAALTEGIETLDAYFSQYAPQILLAAVVPLAILAVVFPVDLLSGVVLLLTGPLIPIFMILIGGIADDLTRKQWLSLSRMSAYFLDVLQGLATLKLFGRSHEQVQKIAGVSEHFRQATMSILRVTFLSALVMEWVATLSTAIVAVQVGLRLLYGYVNFEQAFLVLVLAPEFYLPLRLLGQRFHAGMAGETAAERLFALLDHVAPPAAAGAAVQARLPAAQALDIRFQNVSFQYPGRQPVLTRVSFQLAAGQQTALVGVSGAGKSTIAQLLLRFSEPSEGQVLANGQAIGALDRAGWRAQVAWVPQNPRLFYGSIADNIRLARPEAGLEQIRQAARQSQADEFIQKLPQGYATLLGEGGQGLSAGQVQRIALARAFLKNAPLLILDEATANLDPETESLLQQTTGQLAAGRTTLVIAHRLHTIERADRILVLDEGQIVQQGSHHELLQQPGLYRQLAAAYAGSGALQFAAYENDEPAAWPIPTSPGRVFNRQTAGPLAERPSSAWRTLLRLLHLMRPLAGWVTLSVLLGMAAIISSVGLMSTSAYIIARAALHPSIAEIQVAIVGVRFFGLARGAFRYLERLVSHQATFRVLAQIRVHFYQALEPLAPARLQMQRSGDLLARLIQDIAALENLYVRALAPPVIAVGVLLAVSGWMFSFHPLAALLLGAFLLAGGALLPLAIGRLGAANGSEIVQSRSRLNTLLVDGLQGCSDLLVFGQEQAYLERADLESERLGSLQRHSAHLHGLQSALGGWLANLGMVATLALGIRLVQAGALDSVYLGMLALGALTSFDAVLPLPQAAQHLSANLAAGERLFQVIENPPAPIEPQDIANPAPVEEEPAGQARPGSLEVCGLTFRYPLESQPQAKPVLQDLHFTLPEGGHLAIVGPSGAGKSTLVNLLLRFWDYQQGTILLGGKDLRSIPAEQLRAWIGVVSQNTYLFSASVRDNLLLARPQASEEQIIGAARQAHIHDFIQSLPKGYDTWIGEHGLRLSAGERQRLAIARVLLKDPPILILDEATANLDALTENAILAELKALRQGRTTLTITHRPAGLEDADEILVLREGQIVGRGREAGPA